MRNICLGNFDQGGYILFTNLLTVQSQKPERDIKPVLNMGNTDNGNLNESAIEILRICYDFESFREWKYESF
jgi:hypothetical protein